MRKTRRYSTGDISDLNVFALAPLASMSSPASSEFETKSILAEKLESPISNAEPQSPITGTVRRKHSAKRLESIVRPGPSTAEEVAKKEHDTKSLALLTAKIKVATLSSLLAEQEKEGRLPAIGQKWADFFALLIIFPFAAAASISISQTLRFEGAELSAAKKLMGVGGFVLLTTVSLACKWAAPLIQKKILAMRSSDNARHFFLLWNAREEQRRAANSAKADMTRSNLGIVGLKKSIQDAIPGLIRPTWSIAQEGIALLIAHYSIGKLTEKAALEGAGVFAFLLLAVVLEKYLVKGIGGLVGKCAKKCTCCCKETRALSHRDRKSFAFQLVSKLRNETTFLDSSAALQLNLSVLIHYVGVIVDEACSKQMASQALGEKLNIAESMKRFTTVIKNNVPDSFLKQESDRNLFRSRQQSFQVVSVDDAAQQTPSLPSSATASRRAGYFARGSQVRLHGNGVDENRTITGVTIKGKETLLHLDGPPLPGSLNSFSVV